MMFCAFVYFDSLQSTLKPWDFWMIMELVAGVEERKDWARLKSLEKNFVRVFVDDLTSMLKVTS